MAEVGKYNTLKINRQVDFGAYLDGEELGEILMPKRYLEPDAKPGDMVTVFVYLDSEDRLVATTETPLAQVGDFALLKVVSVDSMGAFLDWGIMKDLLVPFREQKKTMMTGISYLVYIYFDQESKRLAASAKLDKFLDNVPAEYKEGEKVELMIAGQTDIGFKAIINKLHWGVLYKNEVFCELRPGDTTDGYIKKVREDGKIDLCLQPAGYDKIYTIRDLILDKLNKNKGFLALSDKSPAEEIYAAFGISKKTFKQTIGSLYKDRIISIDDKGITLIAHPEGD